METVARRSLLAAAVAALSLTSPGGAALPCDADLDRDGQVGVTDLLSLLSQWGTDPGGPPDFDGNGVGVTDLLTLLGQWGPVTFDYGPPPQDPEAGQIGLEMLGAAGPLLVPPAVYARIDFDLAAIRHTVIALADETHTPAWAPDRLIVNLVPGAVQDDYLCLNEQFQVLSVVNLFGDWWLITFPGSLNVPALAQLYAATPAVQFAEPDALIGGQNFWTPLDLGGGLWRWTIDDGFCDCFDGCDCHVIYVIETDGQGAVNVISVQESGFPWCDFKAGSC